MSIGALLGLLVLQEVGELGERGLGDGVLLPQVGRQEAVRAAQSEEGSLQNDTRSRPHVSKVMNQEMRHIATAVVRKSKDSYKINFGSRFSSFDETIRGLALFQNHSRGNQSSSPKSARTLTKLPMVRV